jgi:hypothetical protein
MLIGRASSTDFEAEPKESIKSMIILGGNRDGIATCNGNTKRTTLLHLLDDSPITGLLIAGVKHMHCLLTAELLHNGITWVGRALREFTSFLSRAYCDEKEYRAHA